MAKLASTPWTEDAALARRSRTDESGRAAIYRAHCDDAYRLALRLLGSRQDAEDATQETFIQVFRSLASYRGESSLRTWIHRIAVRTALRHRWRAKRNPATLVMVPEQAPADADACCDHRRAVQAIYPLLQRLSAKRRAVFLLHEVEEYSLPEAAALLGISCTAAKKLVWRARRDLARLVERNPRLRDYLDGDPEQSDG